MSDNQSKGMSQGEDGKGRKVKRVLGDHVQYGKKFRPPLLDYMLGSGQGQPDLEWVRWILPEMLWIKLLIYAHGLNRAGELISIAIRAGRSVSPASDRDYCLVSDFSFIGEEQISFTSEIGEKTHNEFSHAFSSFVRCYPDFPMAWIVRKEDMDCSPTIASTPEHIQRGLVSDLRSRRDRPAMEMQVCALFGLIASEKLVMHRVPDLNLISEYPDTVASKSMGSHVRAILNVYLRRTTGSKWSKSFWERGRRISQCQILV